MNIKGVFVVKYDGIEDLVSLDDKECDLVISRVKKLSNGQPVLILN